MRCCTRLIINSIIVLILALTLSGCRSWGDDLHLYVPSEDLSEQNVISEPEPEPPPPPNPLRIPGQVEDVPMMEIRYVTRSGINEAIIMPGTFSWDILYDDGSALTTYADTLTSLGAGHYLYFIDDNNNTTSVEIFFSHPPNNITVRRWRDDMIENAAEYYNSFEWVDIANNIIQLSPRDAGYIYDIMANWDQGYAYYGFRVMSLPWHVFQPHSIPETDPNNFPRLNFVNQINENMTLYPINFAMPEDYTNVIGVTTFRGNNFRNNPTWGTVDITYRRLEIQYEIRIGSIGGWTGVGWTGQPAIIKWDIEMQQMMNIHSHMHNGEGLVEVIQGAMDGFIYFFELFSGEETRPRINFGDVIKGGVTVDARGYPLLYVGQGDNMRGGRFGYFIFSLIDGSELFHIDGRDPFSSRRWGAFDANPLFDTEHDRVIIAGENGVIYSVLLNTEFDRLAGTIAVDPIMSRYKHTGTRRLGTENSPAGFGHYIFFADNSGLIQCLDLRTLEPVWVFDAGDDKDATLVLEWEADIGRLLIYTATEVDLIGRAGNAYIRKLDAATGEVLWEQTVRCGYNPNVNGGVLATPIVGKNDISHLVIFSVARTLDRASYGTVIAFCKETGEEVWEFAKSTFGWSSPVAVYTEDGTSYIIVADANGRVSLLRGTTGEELHRINVGSNVEASPAVFNNMLVVGTRGQRILGIKIT